MRAIWLITTLWLLPAGWAGGSDLTANGPLFAIWHIDGHGYRWQLEQFNAGLPLEPSIRMVAFRAAQAPKQLGKLNAEAGVLSRFDAGPIVIRCNNITNELDQTFPRIEPLTDDNWRESALCVRIHPESGALDQTPHPDPFGPVEKWTAAGRLWATSPWMERLQTIIPNPTHVVWRANNEGPRIKFKLLTKPASILERIGGAKGATQLAWRTRAELEAISIRIAEWVEGRRSTAPEDCEDEFIARENALYHALFTEFDAHLSEGWRGKLGTVGYGGFEENLQNDAASISFYPGHYVSSILTSPEHALRLAAYREQWTANDAAHPRSWRELSITLQPTAVTAGAVAGEHDPVDPQSFAGFFTAVAWHMQSPGRAVRLTYWDNSKTPPDFVLVSPKPQVQAELATLGRPDLVSMTVEDCELALLRELDRIHDDPTLNRYWRQGTTSLLESPQNSPDRVQVYATQTAIDGEARDLLCVYTPCTLEQIQAGTLTLPAARFAYYLTNPLEPLPQPAVERPQTGAAGMR